MSLSTLDLSIIALYLISTLWLGLYLARRENHQGEDFFVAGRNLGWLAIGASLFASNISSEHLIGLSADGFRSGLAVGNYEWGASLVLILLAAVFVPFYVGSKIGTVPEYLERRFGRGSRLYLSLLTITANVLVRISVALYAGGLVVEKMLGWNMWAAIFVLSIITVVYTAAGGLKAVVYTDALQAVILLVGTIALTTMGLERVGGWHALKTHLDPSFFEMVRPNSDPEMPWLGLLLGVPVLGVWYWCTDQVIVQRVLGAKDIHNARMGALFAGFLKILPVFLFVLPGLLGRVLFPDAESHSIFPLMVEQLLPPGLKGLVAAALLAALMSSIDSTLNSTGTLVSLDLYKIWKPQASARQVLRVGQVTTLVVMVFGIAWVLVVMRAESLFQYLQQVNAAISPPIASAFLVGIFWKRANHKGVLSALAGGLLVGLGLLVWDAFPFLISAAITFGFSVVAIVVVSLMTAPPQSYQVDRLTWASVGTLVDSQSSPLQLWVFRITATVLFITMVCLWWNFK